MIALLTNIVPVILGFLAKLTAIKMQMASDQQKLMIEAMSARNHSLQQARNYGLKESPFAAMTRRIFIMTVLALMVFMVVAPALFNIDTVVPVVQKGFSFLGFEITPDRTEYITVKGMLLLEEVRLVFVMIAEMYFGATLARGR